MRSWDDEGRVAGPVPEWLLDRLDFMAPLQLANNTLDDLTTADSAVAISRLWLRCPSARSSARESCQLAAAPSTTRASATRRWSSMASVACAAQRLEIFCIAGGIAGVVLLLVPLVALYTRFVRDMSAA